MSYIFFQFINILVRLPLALITVEIVFSSEMGIFRKAVFLMCEIIGCEIKGRVKNNYLNY